MAPHTSITLPSIHSLDLPFLRNTASCLSPSSFAYRSTSTSEGSFIDSRSPSPASSISSSSSSSFFSGPPPSSCYHPSSYPPHAYSNDNGYGHDSFDNPYPYTEVKAYDDAPKPLPTYAPSASLRSVSSSSSLSSVSSVSSTSSAPSYTTAPPTGRKPSTKLRLVPCPFADLDAVIIVPLSPSPPFSRHPSSHNPSYDDSSSSSHYHPNQPHSSLHPNQIQLHTQTEKKTHPLMLTGPAARAFRHPGARRAVGARARVHPYRVVGGSYSGRRVDKENLGEMRMRALGEALPRV